MIFEDFFWVTRDRLEARATNQRRKELPLRIDKTVNARIASVMPFKLTKAQRTVTAQIFNDMKSKAPMNRLLQGDVGSGKTIVAVIAMMAAMENGFQTALMAPTKSLRSNTRVVSNACSRRHLIAWSC